MTTQLLTTPSAADASALAAVISPGSPDYDSARASFNLAVDQHPAAIAYPSTAADVIERVRDARATGLKVVDSAGRRKRGLQRVARTERNADPNRLTPEPPRLMTDGRAPGVSTVAGTPGKRPGFNRGARI